jgi:hypothetical protein
MKDSEIDDMVGKLGGKNNPPPGPLPLKFLVSSFKIARVAPKIIPTLIANVIRG